MHCTQSFTGPALYARLCSSCTIAVQALHDSQGSSGPAVYAELCRPCTVRRALPGLHYAQGFVGHPPYVRYRPSTLRRSVQSQHCIAVKALNYLQGCTGHALHSRLFLHTLHSTQDCAAPTGPALYAGFCRPFSIRRLCRPCTVRKTVQALHCTKGCAVPALYAGLYRSCTICRDVHDLHFFHGRTGPALKAGL